ncbi:MAG: hypothetical protein NZ934_04920 [Hadesarchaea archaeon]|nr:hypothetical protein [Hadesarchaea archaeon]
MLIELGIGILSIAAAGYALWRLQTGAMREHLKGYLREGGQVAAPLPSCCGRFMETIERRGTWALLKCHRCGQLLSRRIPDSRKEPYFP